MSDKTPEAVASNAELGPLPEPYTRQWINCPFTERLLFTEGQMRAYRAEGVAAERERCAPLVARLERIAEGVRVYGAPDNALLAARIENLCAELKA